MTKPPHRAAPPSAHGVTGDPATNAVAHAWAQVGAALSPHPDCPLPSWTGGGDTLHQHLLVIGTDHDADWLNQLCHLDAAAARFGKVGFVGPASVRRLVEWSMGETVVVLSRMPRDVSDWDLRCPITALARALGPQAAATHAGRPYLWVASTAARHWRDRLAAAAQHGFCVGFGGLRTIECDANGASHASRFAALAPLLRVPGVSWVPLGAPASDATLDAIVPETVDWIDWRADCEDLADEASLIDNLDLVISLDAAHVHLAAGLGVPVWQLNASPAATRHEPHRSTHFSPENLAEMRAFRLPSPGNDWPGAVDAAASALLALATEFQGWTR